MYRKRNGSLGFSFTRFANTVVPNFFADTSPSTASALAGLRKDMCYAHQLSSPNPFALDQRSFYVAGVVDNEAVSRKVYKALRKHGILRSDDYATSSTSAKISSSSSRRSSGGGGGGGEEKEEEKAASGGTGEVDTHKIGKAFVHQLACINVMRQRELINMLFWWEEETQRLKKLIAEEKELDGMIDAAEELVVAQQQQQQQQQQTRCESESGNANDDVGTREKLDQLKFARERIRMKKRQRPSQRRADVEADKDDLMGVFYGRSRSCPQIHAPGVQDGVKPPAYYAPG